MVKHQLLKVWVKFVLQFYCNEWKYVFFKASRFYYGSWIYWYLHPAEDDYIYPDNNIRIVRDIWGASLSGDACWWDAICCQKQKISWKYNGKINGKLQNFESFHEILANFDLKKRILIKIKAILMEFCKDLIILKETKKPSDKFLHVWAKNQLRFEIFEKILEIYMQKSQWKIDFLSIFLIFQDFFILYTSVTYQNLGGGLGGYFSPGLGGYFRIGGSGVV